jgi:hypothetical protein
MIREFLSQACTELDLPTPALNERKAFPFVLGKEVEVEIRDLEPGVSFFSKMCLCPVKAREDLFMVLMRANYLGQSTGATRIGMSGDEKYLTLSSSMPYELNYRTFRESLEDFINFLLYWREEVEKFKDKETLL